MFPDNCVITDLFVMILSLKIPVPGEQTRINKYKSLTLMFEEIKFKNKTYVFN